MDIKVTLTDPRFAPLPDIGTWEGDESKLYKGITMMEGRPFTAERHGTKGSQALKAESLPKGTA